MSLFRETVLDESLVGRSLDPALIDDAEIRHPRPNAAERAVTCGDGAGYVVWLLPGCTCNWCCTVRTVAARDFGVLVTW